MPSDITIGDNRLEMTRVFAYPRAAVFEAWTDTDQLAKWWGCRDTVSVRAESDLRVGGVFRYVMQHRHAGEMIYEGTYTEIKPPERLSTRTVMGEGTQYAFESTTTVEFIEEAEDVTRVTLTQIGLPPMPNACDIVSTGFEDAFNKLDSHLVG